MLMESVSRVGRIDMPSLKAIYDDDLVEFLNSIKLYSKIDAGRVRCKFCSEPVTLENFLAVLPESGTIHVVCDKLICQGHAL